MPCSLWRDEIWIDGRRAFRSLTRSPEFTLVVVLVIGLGIGATTAIFSIVNAVLIRPFLLRDPDRLAMLFETAKDAPIPRFPVSPPDLLDFQRDQQSFEGLGAYQNVKLELGGGGSPERIIGARVTASLFPLLGAELAAGRSFSPEEDVPGAGVAILSHHAWQQRFGGRDVVGQTILVNRQPHIIIGVMSADFQFPVPGGEFNAQPADVFVPMAFTAAERESRGMLYDNSVIGRLKPGVTLDQARAALPMLVAQALQGYSPVFRPNELGAQLVPLRELFSGSLRTPLLMLLGAVTLVLLIACANVAALFLSRAAGREHEMSVRVALGASQRRLRQMLLIESLILATMSGAVGLGLAWGGTRLLPSYLPASIRLPEILMDGRVLAFVLGVALATALFCGFAPMIWTKAVDLERRIRQTSGAVTTGGRRLFIQKGLVIATVALSVVLLISASLLVRSFLRLLAVDPGFRSDRVLTMSLTLPAPAYLKGEQVEAFYRNLMERLRSLPGVRAAGAATDLPFVQGDRRVFTPDGSPVNEPDATRLVAQTWVLGDYLQAMGVRLAGGRFFSPDDRLGRERVALVSESLAWRFWPGGDAVGKRIKWGGRQSRAPWLTVVGVVADVRESRLDRDAQIHMYTPYLQEAVESIGDERVGLGRLRELHVALWTASDPRLFMASTRREVQRLDPALAIANLQPMEEHLTRAAAPRRASTSVLVMFAASALLMVSIGLYGLLAYSVAQRRREIGVRLALGAERSHVVGMVLAQGAKLVAAGVALGLAASLFVSRVLESQLYQTPARDVWTYAGAPVVLAIVAVAACAVPALRAARVDPVRALRLD
jgi:putative ABC transport system permease protein